MCLLGWFFSRTKDLEPLAVQTNGPLVVASFITEHNTSFYVSNGEQLGAAGLRRFQAPQRLELEDRELVRVTRRPDRKKKKKREREGRGGASSGGGRREAGLFVQHHDGWRCGSDSLILEAAGHQSIKTLLLGRRDRGPDK